MLILFDQGVRPRHLHILSAEFFFIHIHYRRIVSCRRAVVQACGDLKTASLVVSDRPLLVAGSGPDLQVHNSPVPDGDLIERGVGEVEVRAVAAAPPLVAGVRVVAWARVGDHDGDCLLAGFAAAAPGAEVAPVLAAGRAVDAHDLVALAALIGQAPVVATVRVPGGYEVVVLRGVGTKKVSEGFDVASLK